MKRILLSIFLQGDGKLMLAAKSISYKPGKNVLLMKEILGGIFLQHKGN